MVERENNKPISKAPVVALRLGGNTLQFTGLLTIIPSVVLLAMLAGAVYLVSRTTQTLLWLSAILWILFIAYWSAAATNAAQTRHAESQQSRQLHQLLMYGALVLAFVRLPGLDRRWLPSTGYVLIVGFVIQISSALLAVWARQHLGRNWSGAITAKVDHQLVRSGPYRRLRHPIYSAMLGMFIGSAVVSGEFHGLLAVIIMAVAYWRKIRLEEQHLRGIFGDEYVEYQRNSWALIPGLM